MKAWGGKIDRDTNSKFLRFTGIKRQSGIDGGIFAVISDSGLLTQLIKVLQVLQGGGNIPILKADGEAAYQAYTDGKEG